MTYLGIDQSKRSTGCTWVDAEGELVAFMLICPDKELDGVALIDYQWEQLSDYLFNYQDADYAIIEGLAFGAVGSGKDMLSGLNWYFRTRAEREHRIFMGTAPVSMWRSKVLSKEEQREAKTWGKDGLKLATVRKLPMGVLTQFEEYIAKNKFKKTSLYDLTDSYFIAQHCRFVNTKH